MQPFFDEMYANYDMLIENMYQQIASNEKEFIEQSNRTTNYQKVRIISKSHYLTVIFSVF